MSNVKLTAEAISFGHAVFLADGNGEKLAVVTVGHHAGLYRNGVGVEEPLGREQWSIHWCRPLVSVGEAEAVTAFVASLPDATASLSAP